MHITPDASGYFENMWLWAADHAIDDSDLNDAYNDMPFVSVYVGRGLLIESRWATWLYGTAVEHAVFYQYNSVTTWARLSDAYDTARTAGAAREPLARSCTLLYSSVGIVAKPIPLVPCGISAVPFPASVPMNSSFLYRSLVQIILIIGLI